MLDSFFAALRVVFPMVVLMALGALARSRGVIDRPAMRQFDRLIFRLFMPALLFKNIYEMPLSDSMAGMMLFAAAGLLALFAAMLWLAPRLTEDGNKAAVIVQAVVRANYILFGVAVAESLYGEGNTGSVALLGAFAVPAINVLSVIVLELNRSGRARPGPLLIAILRNPMIIGALLAFALKPLPPMPRLIWGVVRSVAGVTTTVSFISLGVGLNLERACTDMRPLLWGVGLRMVAVPLVFLPLAALAGFRGPELCALMVLFAAPAAVASYPMAVAMGADGQLAGQLVCATTLASVFTFFLWTFAFRGMGLL